MTKQAKAGDLAMVQGIRKVTPGTPIANGDVVQVVSNPFRVVGEFWTGGSRVVNTCRIADGGRVNIRTSALIPLDPPPESRRLVEDQMKEQTA